MIILWGIGILCGIFSALLLMGKGSFLIAGYNTASDQEKRRYDEKRLCRVVGTYMGILSLLLILWAIWGEETPDWFILVFLAVTLLGMMAVMILSLTVCRVELPVEEETPRQRAKREANTKRAVAGSVIFTGILFLFIGIMLFTGDVKVVLGEKAVEIQASYWPDHRLPKEKIRKVSYTEELEPGKRTNGLGSPKLLEGNFRNEAYGDYLLYVYKKCESYVVLETREKTVVLNGETREKTRELYRELKAWVGE